MSALKRPQENIPNKKTAKEPLEYRLGTRTTKTNVTRLAYHITQLEKEARKSHEHI